MAQTASTPSLNPLRSNCNFFSQAAGGTYSSGNCPNDPANIKCCTKPKCGTGSTSSCRWTLGVSSCSGSTLTGQCPGPSGFKCCVAPGTWSRPTIPGTSTGCKSHVITAGNRALDVYSGHIQSVGCVGSRSGTSDHPAGLALDFMVGVSVSASTESDRN